MNNWGILGTGNIAKTFASAIKGTERSKLIAVGSRSKESADLFASTYDCIGFDDYQKLLHDQDINSIYISTPHTSHFEFSYKALMNGKSVLCEKPLTMNSSEAMLLFNLAKKKQLLLMEAFMYRMHPQTDKIRELVQENFKGKKIEIKASFGFKANVKQDHRLLNPKLGGGSILDVGCYPLSMARLIVGLINGKEFMDPDEYEVISEINEYGIDLSSEAKLIFLDGSSAYLASSIKENLENSVEITDGKRTLLVRDPWHCGEYKKNNNSLIISEGNKKISELNIDAVGKIYINEINHFDECLKNSVESIKISHKDSYGNAVCLDKWRRLAGVRYDFDEPENNLSSFNKSLFENKENLIPKIKIEGLDSKVSKLVFGCDNQIDTNHAFSMFDHFYSMGGNVFDLSLIHI